MALWAMSVIWGLPYFFIKLAVDELSPAFVAWSRVVLAVAVVLPLAWRLGALHGLRSHGAPLAAFATVEVAAPFFLISLGERHIASSFTGILIAVVPLTVALLAVRFAPSERPDRMRLIGLVAGFGGVLLLLGLDVAGNTLELFGAACVLLATLGYALGPLIVNRRLSTLDPLGSVAVALVIASVMLAPAALVSAPPSVPSAEAMISILALGLICTALGMILFFFLIAEAGPSRATVITYINPAVAVILGVTLLDEPIGLVAVAGLLLILAGSWMSTGGRTPPGLATAWRWMDDVLARVRSERSGNRVQRSHALPHAALSVPADPHCVGLGLAIVKSITQAHDGTLTLTPRAAGGLRVTVQLPA
jgi:drug/metabolite transporter (DMT)-like permease